MHSGSAPRWSWRRAWKPRPYAPPAPLPRTHAVSPRVTPSLQSGKRDAERLRARPWSARLAFVQHASHLLELAKERKILERKRQSEDDQVRISQTMPPVSLSLLYCCCAYCDSAWIIRRSWGCLLLVSARKQAFIFKKVIVHARGVLNPSGEKRARRAATAAIRGKQHQLHIVVSKPRPCCSHRLRWPAAWRVCCCRQMALCGLRL